MKELRESLEGSEIPLNHCRGRDLRGNRRDTGDKRFTKCSLNLKFTIKLHRRESLDRVLDGSSFLLLYVIKDGDRRMQQ